MKKNSMLENEDKSMTKTSSTSKEEWIKGLYILLYFAICYVAAFVTFFIVIFQFVCTLITKHPNEHIARLGQSISMYAYEIIRFITYNTDQKPFPFKAWPNPSIVVEAHTETKSAKK